MPSRLSLQFVVLVPVLLLMTVAGVALYFLVLRTVGDFVDESIRASLDSLARSAFSIADAEVDRQNRDGRAGEPAAAALYQLDARMRLEDFARAQEVGVIVEVGGTVDFTTGTETTDVDAIRRVTKSTSTNRLDLSGGEVAYARPVAFAPWNWRLILVKDATAFEVLLSEVRAIYVGSGLALLMVTGLLVLWLRQVLVRPIFRIAKDFEDGRAPIYSGVKELEFLSARISEMMESLKAKTLQLETTLESMSDGIAVFDSKMRLAMWNKHYVQLYRYPNKLIQTGIGFVDIMRFNVDRGDYGPGDVEAQLDEIVERARKLNPPRFEIDRADGSSMEVRRASMPDGGFVTTYTDITDRKQVVEAEAASAAKSQFLRNMSHDLRKPITAIIEDVCLMLDRSDIALPEKLRGNLENVQVSSSHLLGMVDEILEMSRLEAGQVEVKTSQVQIDALVVEGLRIIDPIAKAKGIALETDVEDGLTAVTDPRLLSRVLMNLAVNAAEHTKEGTIRVAGRRHHDRIIIDLSDTGVGIPTDKLEIIFDKFQQVESTAGVIKPGMGLGLGLAISREFVHLLGGTISVRSEVGIGSVFTISIPDTYSVAA